MLIVSDDGQNELAGDAAGELWQLQGGDER